MHYIMRERSSEVIKDIAEFDFVQVTTIVEKKRGGGGDT